MTQDASQPQAVRKEHWWNTKLVVSLATTVFGTVAIAIISSIVTSNLGNKELQFKAMSALMEHTISAELNEDTDITKLKALTELIEENDEFKVKIDGFREIVSGFYKDRLTQARKQATALELQLEEASKSQKQAIQARIDSLNVARANYQEILDTEKKTRTEMDRELQQQAIALQQKDQRIEELSALLGPEIMQAQLQLTELLCVRDGVAGKTTWAFAVKVDGDRLLEIPARRYQNHDRLQTLPNAEGLDLDRAKPFAIEVEGFGPRAIRGQSGRIAFRHDEQKPEEIKVHVWSETTTGDFDAHFVFTFELTQPEGLTQK